MEQNEKTTPDLLHSFTQSHPSPKQPFHQRLSSSTSSPILRFSAYSHLRTPPQFTPIISTLPIRQLSSGRVTGWSKLSGVPRPQKYFKKQGEIMIYINDGKLNKNNEKILNNNKISTRE